MTDTTDAGFARNWNDAIHEEARSSVALDGDTRSEPEPPAATEPSSNLTPAEIVRRLGLPIEMRDGLHYCPVCNIGQPSAQGFGPHFNTHWREAGVDRWDIPAGTDLHVPCTECSHRARRDLLIGHLRSRHGIDNNVARGLARTAGFNIDTYLTSDHVEPAKRGRDGHGREYDLIDCPEKACGAVQRRKNMRTHLLSVHHYAKDDASAACKHAKVSRFKSPQKSKLSGLHRNKDMPQRETAPAVIEQPTKVVPPPTEPSFDFAAISADDIAIGVVQSQINGSLPTHLLPTVIAYVDHTREVVTQLRASRS